VSKQRNYFPEERSGICVRQRDGESDDSLIKRFRKKYSKSGMAKELRERMYFEKPSDKKRRKLSQQIRAIKKEEEKQQKIKEKAKKEKIKRKWKESKRNDRSSKRQNNFRKVGEKNARRDYTS
jgi:small subunit ribosomal protein S21